MALRSHEFGFMVQYVVDILLHKCFSPVCLATVALRWLQYHDRDTGDLCSMALAIGMKVALTQHLDRSTDKLLKGSIGRVHSWQWHEKDRLPSVVYVKFDKAAWQLDGIDERVYPIRPVGKSVFSFISLIEGAPPATFVARKQHYRHSGAIGERSGLSVKFSTSGSFLGYDSALNGVSVPPLAQAFGSSLWLKLPLWFEHSLASFVLWIGRCCLYPHGGG